MSPSGRQPPATPDDALPLARRLARAREAGALSLYAGSALSAGAIKLSAKQLLAMPLPRERAVWGVAASHFKAASGAESDAVRARELRAFGEASCAAHALEDRSRREVLGFWMARLK